MAEYIYLIIRINEIGEKNVVAACKTEALADEYQVALDKMQEGQQLGWSYVVKPLKVSI